MPVQHDPPEYRVYLWNMTNLDEMKTERAKPQMEEVGPICFDLDVDSEFTTRNESATYSFQQTFRKRECGNGIVSVPYDSVITHLNVPYVMTRNALKDLAEGSRRQFEKLFAKEWNLFAEHTVDQLLHGYSDPTWQKFISKGVAVGTGQFRYLWKGESGRKEINVPVENADEIFAVNWTDGKEFIPLGETILEPIDLLNQWSMNVIDESHSSVGHFRRLPSSVSLNSFNTIQFNKEINSTTELSDGKDFLFEYFGRDASKFTSSSPHFFGLGNDKGYGACVGGLSPDEGRHLSRHNLDAKTGVLIDGQHHMQLNMHLSKEDFERDGYWMECDELEFPLLWETRLVPVSAHHLEVTKPPEKLDTLGSAPLVLASASVALPVLAVVLLVGIVVAIVRIRTWKLNRRPTVNQMVENEGFIEKFDEED